MKILHINRNYLTSALHQVMMNHMEDFDFSHTVFAPTDDLAKAVIKPNENVIAAACFNNFDRFFFDLKQMKIQKALENRISVREYGLIHAYTLFTDGNCAMKLSQKYRIPYVVAVRNTDVNDFFRRLPYLRSRGIEIMRRASKVFFLSASYRDQVFQKYIPQKYQDEILSKSVIIPNGIDDFWLENSVTEINEEKLKRIQERKINLIFAGRIDRNKNIPTTVAAMERLLQDGWDAHLTVVGKVEDQKEYQKFADLPYVSYYPAVGKEKLIEYYRQSDIFVMPSHTESFGLVYAEAMTQGLPVIYTKGQGFDGQFPESVVGYHVNPNDPLDIVMQLKKLCNEYERISIACSRKCKNFLWDDIARTYSKIYSEVL